MDVKKLNENIAKIEKSIENEELADGLDILAATLSHALALSIQSGNFNRNKLHEFFEEMENRIMSATKNDNASGHNIGIRRKD
jgi:hypothetical protein